MVLLSANTLKVLLIYRKLRHISTRFPEIWQNLARKKTLVSFP